MASPAIFSFPDKRLIADLRAKIARMKSAAGASGSPAERTPVALGADALDAALGGGLRRACLHEVAAADESPAAAGFCAAVLARLAGERGIVVWCRRGDELHGPGLAAFGLDAARLIVARPRGESDLLWSMEEGLRSRAPAAVLGETAGGGAVALRRLQLAAESGGVSALLLRPAGTPPAPSPALTRWRIGAAGPSLSPSGAPSWRGPWRSRWRVELQRCRSGTPSTWLLEWCDETRGFVVAAELRDRPAHPAAQTGGPHPAIRA